MTPLKIDKIKAIHPEIDRVDIIWQSGVLFEAWERVELDRGWWTRVDNQAYSSRTNVLSTAEPEETECLFAMKLWRKSDLQSKSSSYGLQQRRKKNLRKMRLLPKAFRASTHYR